MNASDTYSSSDTSAPPCAPLNWPRLTLATNGLACSAGTDRARRRKLAAMSSVLSDMFIVDADSHWSEPADLFTRLAPPELKHRVPHHEEIDGQRMWVMDGVPIGAAGAGAVIGADGLKKPSAESLMKWK